MQHEANLNALADEDLELAQAVEESVAQAAKKQTSSEAPEGSSSKKSRESQA